MASLFILLKSSSEKLKDEVNNSYSLFKEVFDTVLLSVFIETLMP